MKSPIETLQENATAFFKNVSEKHPETYQCGKGCSKCCEAQFSIFTSEADRVRKWFTNLNHNQRLELKVLWSQWRDLNLKSNRCVFLNENICSIYEARPIICRTQGLPLYFRDENKLDICQLNNTEENLSDKNEWLDLERLNKLLVLTCSSGERIALSDLQADLLNN